MGDVEEAVPRDHRSCCCPVSANRRRPSPDDVGDQLVKKSKKQLFPEASTSLPPSSPSDPLPYSQLIRKLRDRISMLSDCLDQRPLSEIVSQEEEQSGAISETDAPNALVTDQQDGEDLEANNSDEAVRLEKRGDSLNIHFRCPCGKSYHFMLSQGSCFYKLM